MNHAPYHIGMFMMFMDFIGIVCGHIQVEIYLWQWTIAQDFYSIFKIDLPIEDIQLTGSLANYNWTPKSDLDVHVLIDFSKVDPNKDLVERALDGQRFIWNLRHNIIIRGHDVELYIQDVNEPHVASGLFSLQRNEWIKTPISNFMIVKMLKKN